MKLAEQSMTVAQVAKKLGVTPGRIRQLCIEHTVGVLFTPRIRILSPRDESFLKRVLDSQVGGRPRKNTEKVS